MAKGKRKGPIKRGTMHNALRNKGNQMRAGMARMQSEGKLWKKVKKERKASAGTESKSKFFAVIDRARNAENRAGRKTTMPKKSWLSKIAKGLQRQVRKAK